MIEVSVALREGGVAPHAMVWLIYMWGGGEITPKAEKSLNHSILTFIDREMRLGHVDT